MIIKVLVLMIIDGEFSKRISFWRKFCKKKLYFELEIVENGDARWKRNLRCEIVYRVIYGYIGNVIIFFIYV